MTESERTPPRGNLTRALVKRMRAEEDAKRSTPSSVPPSVPPLPSPLPERDDDTVPRVELPKVATPVPAPRRTPVPAPASSVRPAPAAGAKARPRPAPPPPAPPPPALPEIEQRWDEDTPAPMWISASEERTSVSAPHAELPVSWSMPAQAAPELLTDSRPASAAPVAARPLSVRPAAVRSTPAPPATSRPPSVVLPKVALPSAPPAPAWPPVQLPAPRSMVEEQPLQPASGRGWKLGVALGAASLIAFATYGLWPRAKPAEHAAYEQLAPSPEPMPEPPSVATGPDPLAAPVTPAVPSVPLPSAEPRESADDEDVELTGSARGEREEREREEREQAEPSASPSEPREPEKPPSAASGRPSTDSKVASTPAAPTARGVLRVTPAPTVRAEPLARVQAPNPAPAAAAVPPPVAPPAPAAPARVAPARGLTRDAVVLEQVVPKFPARARRLEVTEGTVALEYTVDKTGAVKNAIVISANPPGVFDDAALAAIQRWRYQPKLQDGAPVETRKRFKFTFR